MGGFFGIASSKDAIVDVFFGTDYHSHLGTQNGGIAAYSEKIGLQRVIHRIESSPFRTKFDHVLDDMDGNSAIGSISDSDPQPLLIHSKFGTYAVAMVGRITNADELIKKYLTASGGHFCAMTGGAINSTELVSAMINLKDDFVEGIKFAQQMIEGTANILILKEGGTLIAVRDRVGRLPLLIGKGEFGHCVTFESFAAEKLDYEIIKELGPGEIVEVRSDGIEVLAEAGEEMKICAFLWSYYGYSTSNYEGINVETMRYRNGAIMAETDIENGTIDEIDYVSGIPDSGTPHAIGYSNRSHKLFSRPFIKYTPTWPRSFMSARQSERAKVAKMKQIPVHDLIVGKNLLFIDDSIVRGTQIKETVDFLYTNGAKSVHMRSACPPIMYSCKYLNFSSSHSEMELITRRTIYELEGDDGLCHIDEYADAKTERGRKLREKICESFNFESLEFQSLDGIIKAIGLPACKLCTYCWNGKE